MLDIATFLTTPHVMIDDYNKCLRVDSKSNV